MCWAQWGCGRARGGFEGACLGLEQNRRTTTPSCDTPHTHTPEVVYDAFCCRRHPGWSDGWARWDLSRFTDEKMEAGVWTGCSGGQGQTQAQLLGCQCPLRAPKPREALAGWSGSPAPLPGSRPMSGAACSPSGRRSAWCCDCQPGAQEAPPSPEPGLAAETLVDLWPLSPWQPASCCL